MFPIKCKVPELVPKQTLESTPVTYKINIENNIFKIAKFYFNIKAK